MKSFPTPPFCGILSTSRLSERHTHLLLEAAASPFVCKFPQLPSVRCWCYGGIMFLTHKLHHTPPLPSKSPHWSFDKVWDLYCDLPGPCGWPQVVQQLHPAPLSPSELRASLIWLLEQGLPSAELTGPSPSARRLPPATPPELYLLTQGHLSSHGHCPFLAH